MRNPIEPNRNAIALVIDGQFVESSSELVREVRNPSNGHYIFSIPVGSTADVDLAVASARRSFNDGVWSECAPSVRKKALHVLADLIESDANELNKLDAEEMGKPIGERAFDASSAAALTRFYAESVDKICGDVYSTDRGNLTLQRRVPRGVIGAIVPWNFPTYVAALKCAPALAAGNSVVLKPSELSSRSSVRVAQLALQAGIPPGVFNVVPGLGETVGTALALHNSVDMIAFTGSTPVGKRLLRYSGESNLKVILAECGGKSPQIVFGDGVDLAAASESIARFILTNQGQICSVGSRVLIQNSIESEVVERICSYFKRVVVGDAMDPSTNFGPVASEAQCSRIMRYIDRAPNEGAQLVVGGRRLQISSGGYFIAPTVFRNVSINSELAQEEVFGPVLAVSAFRDEAEAALIANGTKYGLGAYVWTASLSTGMRLAKRIRSDVVINSGPYSGDGAGFAASWEPAGESGVGIESGMAGMESYLRRQLVAFNHA